MSIFSYLDILGTIAFAISGALVAVTKKFDLFGIFIIAFATAIGGGTLRDIFRKEIYATACIFGSITFIILDKFHVNESIGYLFTILIVIAIRLIAVKFQLSLPTIYKKK